MKMNGPDMRRPPFASSDLARAAVVRLQAIRHRFRFPCKAGVSPRRHAAPLGAESGALAARSRPNASAQASVAARLLRTSSGRRVRRREHGCFVEPRSEAANGGSPFPHNRGENARGLGRQAPHELPLVLLPPLPPPPVSVAECPPPTRDPGSHSPPLVGRLAAAARPGWSRDRHAPYLTTRTARSMRSWVCSRRSWVSMKHAST